MKQTAKANASGIKAPMVVHLADLVSFQMVMMVVEHGLCRSENSIRQIAVSKVHPFWSTSKLCSSLMLSSSNIFVAPAYAIRIVGTTISFAGMAMMYARIMTPSSPSATPNGFKKCEHQAVNDCP